MFRLPIVKFFSRILNRITITVVLVALQVAWLAWAFFALTTGRRGVGHRGLQRVKSAYDSVSRAQG